MSSQPYIPAALPLSNLDYRQLLPLVGQANAALARYDGLLQSIPKVRDAGILRELQSGSGRRPATLCFPRLINVAEGREVL